MDFKIDDGVIRNKSYGKLPFTNSTRLKKAKMNGPSQKEIDAARKVLDDLSKAEADALANSKLVCGGCGKKHKIKDCTLIQTHWYVEPCGCTGGDYYKPGESQVLCGGCGIVMRLNFQCKEVQDGVYRKHFKEIIHFYEG